MLAKLDLPADGVITRAVFERLPVAPRNWAWELHDGRLELVHMPVTYWHFNIIAMILDWWRARGHRASGEQYVADTGFVRGGTGRNNYVADGVIFVEGFQPNMDDTTFSSDVIHTIVEAVSSTSEERDADDKFAVYASLGIPNYWIVRRDPRAADPEVVDGMITMYELRDGTYYTAGYKAVSKL